MNSAEDNQGRRHRYLKRLYDKGADELHPCAILEVGRELGWKDSVTDDVENWLEAEGLVRYPTYGQICISHLGKIKVENNVVKSNQHLTKFNTSPFARPSGIFYLVAIS